MSAFNIKQNRIFIYLAIAGFIPGFWGCKSFDGATVAVKPNPLEVHADSVRFTARASIPPKSGIKKDGTYNGQLVIKNGSNSYQMTRVTVPYSKELKKYGGTKSVSASQPYVEGMDGGKLVAVNGYTRKKKDFTLPELELAPCCITTSRLVCTDYKLMTAEHKYESQVPVSLEAKFQFPQNVSAIQPTEFEKASIRAIGEFLKKGYKTSKVEISGFASPEGPFARNKQLSIERSREVQKWLTQQLKEYGYEQYMDSTFFAITTTSEDWAGFKANLDRTNYPEDVKRQVIEIISAGLKEDEKERRVMALVGGAQEVEFILAPLRRATIKMSGESGSHSDEQIQAFATEFIGGKKSTEEFDNFFEKEELLYTVEKSENKAAQKRLLKEFIRKYSDDFRGYLNLAVLELQDGNADEALSLLEKADKLSPNNAMIANNLGVVYLEKGNYEAGLAKLQQAYAARTTPELAFNMGVLNHKKAEYGAAVEMFEKAGDLGCAHYNAGLGKLLQGDLAGAKSELEAAIRSDKDRALNYYVMAIVGAQSADANLMSVNLKRAVTLDSALGKKAQKDLEFRRFWDNAEFQAAVNN